MDDHFRHRPEDRHVEPLFTALHDREHAGEDPAPRRGAHTLVAVLALAGVAALVVFGLVFWALA